MPIIKNVPIYFAKLDPKRPNARLNKTNPTWEVQFRTDDPAQMKEWKELGIRSKVITYPENHDNAGEPILNEHGKKVWRVNIRKRSKDKNGEPAQPVTVVDAKLRSLDPRIIGNGSIANVRIYQYPYEKADKTEGIASVLMGLQVTRLVEYVPRVDDDFEESEEETEVIKANDDDSEETKPVAKKSPAPAKKSPAPKKKAAEEDEEAEEDDGDEY
jgi:hypothetical protein